MFVDVRSILDSVLVGEIYWTFLVGILTSVVIPVQILGTLNFQVPFVLRAENF